MALRLDVAEWILCLRCLLQEAQGDRGWRRRGVRGWRFFAEVRALSGARIDEVLPDLARRGLLDRVDVRAPGRGRPEWLYRITPAGVEALATVDGGARPRLPTPDAEDADAGSVYLTARQWAVLDAVRQPAALDLGPKRWGVRGWIHAREVGRACGGSVSAELRWLRAQRWVERRPAPTDGSRPTYLWRVTARGAAAILVDAAPVGSRPAFSVQLRVPRAGPSRRDADAAWAPFLQREPVQPTVREADRGPTRGEVDKVATEPEENRR